ncbi:unnamed protein product [Phytophthora fragariaefolia]|uniref:Unnamed protein product n=1 Tax=Phytophthora fragariaefolia TaxID=1490495 RepID=A0A9W7CZS9_9STRA|nr:unnamed protein product [Phytophthora fragariaefolia]
MSRRRNTGAARFLRWSRPAIVGALEAAVTHVAAAGGEGWQPVRRLIVDAGTAAHMDTDEQICNELRVHMPWASAPCGVAARHILKSSLLQSRLVTKDAPEAMGMRVELDDVLDGGDLVWNRLTSKLLRLRDHGRVSQPPIGGCDLFRESRRCIGISRS